MTDPRDTHAIAWSIPAVVAYLDPDWQAVYRLAPRGGEVVVIEVSVQPREGRSPRGLVSRQLRAWLRLRDIVPMFEEELRRELATESEPVAWFLGHLAATHGYEDEWRSLIEARAQQWRPWAAVLQRLVSGRTAGDPRRRRLQTAALYVAALQDGQRAPTARVAELQRRRASQVRDDLHAARRDGLLTPGARGQAGGTLTPTALRILNEEEPR